MAIANIARSALRVALSHLDIVADLSFMSVSSEIRAVGVRTDLLRYRIELFWRA